MAAGPQALALSQTIHSNTVLQRVVTTEAIMTFKFGLTQEVAGCIHSKMTGQHAMEILFLTRTDLF